MSNPYRQRVLQDSPNLYWPFDDSSGTRVSNVQQSAYDAWIWTTDYARDVRGPEHTDIWGTRVGSQNGVGISNLPVENQTISVSFWYREVGPRSPWTVLTHGIDWGNRGWALQRNDNTSHIYLYVQSSAGTSSIGFSSSNNVLDGNWHHVALVLHQGVGSLFVDGALISTGQFDPGDGIGHSSLNLVEWIESDGAQRDIAEYGVWHGVALTPAQVQDHYVSAYTKASAEPIRPEVPVNLTADAAGTGQVRLHWNAVPGAEQYVVQRRLVSVHPPTEDDPVGGPPEESPTRSVQELVNLASTGDEVIVPAGVYRETVTITKPLTLSGEPGAEIRGSDDWTNDSWTELNGRFRSSLSATQNNREGRDRFPGGHFPGGPDREEYCRVWVDGVKLAFASADPGQGQFTLDSARRIILGSGINPSTVGLIEVSMRRRWIDIASDDVTVEGLTCQHASNGPFSGGFQSHRHNNVIVRDCAFRHAHGLNVYLTGGDGASRGNSVANCEISHAGCIGLHVAGFSELELSGNSIHHNNAVAFHRHWHAGGVKLYAVEGVNFVGNHLFENNAVGVWFDGPCRHNLIADNRVHDDFIGIYYEVSRDGEVRDNVVFDCHETGIYIGNCSDTVVHNNVVAWNHRGISIFIRDRSGEPYDVGPSAGTHRNVRVHDNSVLYSGGSGLGNVAAVAWEDSPPGWVLGPGHEGSNNRYWVEDTSSSDRPFRWKQNTYKDVSAFASTPAETTASYMSQNHRDALLAEHQVPLAGGTPISNG